MPDYADATSARIAKALLDAPDPLRAAIAELADQHTRLDALARRLAHVEAQLEEARRG